MSVPTSSQPVVNVYKHETQRGQAVGVSLNRTTTMRFMGARPATLLELPAEFAFTTGGCALLPTAPEGKIAALDAIAGALIHMRGPMAPPPAPAAAPKPAAPAAPAMTPPSVTLREGSEGADVRTLQERLIAHGSTMTVDGDFGPTTKKEVKAFQAARGLEADGVVGKGTWAALCQDPAPPPAPAAAPPEAAPPVPVEERPPQHVLVAAHSPGADGALTRARAAVVSSLLWGEREAFASAAAGDATDAWQTIAAWAEERGGALPERDWGALFDRYQQELLARLAWSEADLARVRAGATRSACGGGVGCGGEWTLDKVRLRGHTPSVHDRVDLLFFAPADTPKLACHVGDACEWQKCDVYRKGKYEIDLLQVLPSGPGKTVHVLELPGPDAFVQASGQHVQDGVVMQAGALGDASMLAGLAHALRFLAGSATRQVLVAAHSASAKDATSTLRAEAVLAFLRGREAWAAHAKANMQAADWQRALRWIAKDRGWDEVDPGAVDGLAYGGSQACLREFRKRYRETFGAWLQATGTTPSLADWQAIFDVYDARVKETLGEDPAPLRLAVRALEPGALSCGSSWPSSAVDVEHWIGLRPDRIEVLGFDGPDAPSDVAPPLASVYGGRAYRARYLVPGLGAHRLHVRVVDEADAPVSGYGFEVRLGDAVVREGDLSASGEIEAIVAPGTYDVRVLRPVAPPAAEPEPWEGGDGSLEALLRGDYQRRGSYRQDMSGFKNPDLQRFLAQACAAQGLEPGALEETSATSGSTGDSEQGSRQGMPQWLRKFQHAAMTSAAWGTNEQIMSRLLGAFYYAHFVERYYAPNGIAMPANVEYFLEHLGMSTGNGGATMENINASTDAYCGAASSKAYLRGLERFGWRTSAKGFAPGKWPASGHDCKVPFQQGRNAGEEFRPLPGDVLAVRTSIGPLPGHVVTVVWADTDGTKTGSMWYVSGNAACRSVSCDFVQLADVPGRPPKGSVAVINRSMNHQLQPDRLLALSEGDVEARGCSRAQGSFPGPNAPGKLPPSPPPGPQAADLLAQGLAPSSPVEAPAGPVVLKVELKVARFQGQVLESAPLPEKFARAATPPAETVAVRPGCKLRLEWLVTGADKLVLTPGDLDLTDTTRKGKPWVELSPAATPPGEGGKYRLVASANGREVSAELSVRGIIDFRVTGRAPDDPKKKKPELLERVMDGKKYGTPGFGTADSVGALPGAFRAFSGMNDQDFQHWWWGQITPKADAVLTWKVASPDPVTLSLTVNRKSGSMKALDPVDVTPRTKTEGGLLVGSFDAITEKKYRTFFEADLALIDAGGQELDCATIRLRENYDMPGIASFTVLVDGQQVTEGSTIDRTKQPVFEWELKGDHTKNGLRGEVSDSSGRTLHVESIREWVKDGEAPTPLHKAGKGTKAIPYTFFDGPEGEEALLRLELHNRFGRVERKTIKVRLSGKGAGTPPPGPARIRLFDEDGKAMPKGAYEVRDGGKVLKKGLADAQGFVEAEGLPKTVTVAWGPGLQLVTDVHIDAAEQGDGARLHNMGYSEDVPDRILLFQHRTPGLAPTGVLDDATRSMLQAVHDSTAETYRGGK